MTDPLDMESSGQVTFSQGNGDLPKINITTPRCTAEIYLHGAHVTHFQKTGEAPLLFMSAESEFHPKRSIRGGIPVIFPWFGGREGFPSHGFARTVEWELHSQHGNPDGSVSLRFQMPAIASFEVNYNVTVGETLVLEMAVRNISSKTASFENCLHTYFHIGAITTVSIAGLKDCAYIDKLQPGDFRETAETFSIASEVDRVFIDTTATVEITDPTLARIIRVEKSGSHSTVVWNPWIEKSRAMPDFGDEEYLQMLCVESGNVATNKITLQPGAVSTMKVELSSEALC